MQLLEKLQFERKYVEKGQMVPNFVDISVCVQEL